MFLVQLTNKKGENHMEQRLEETSLKKVKFEEIKLGSKDVLTEANTPIIIGGAACGFSICAGAACGGGCGGVLCGF